MVPPCAALTEAGVAVTDIVGKTCVCQKARPSPVTSAEITASSGPVDPSPATFHTVAVPLGASTSDGALQRLTALLERTTLSLVPRFHITHSRPSGPGVTLTSRTPSPLARTTGAAPPWRITLTVEQVGYPAQYTA